MTSLGGTTGCGTYTLLWQLRGWIDKAIGGGWLEFDLQQETLVQTAHFLPYGFLGRLYWYAMIPFHFFIFRDLCQTIVRHAARQHRDSPAPTSREAADSE